MTSMFLRKSLYSKMDEGERVKLFRKIKPDEVERYFSKKDLNLQDDYHKVPLAYAIEESKDFLVIKALMHMGADPFASMKFLGSPIMRAIEYRKGFDEVLAIAGTTKDIASKSTWDIRDSVNTTPVLSAARHPDIQFLKYFEKIGLSLNDPEPSLDHTKIPDPNSLNSTGPLNPDYYTKTRTALTIAFEVFNTEAVEFLYSLGFSIFDHGKQKEFIGSPFTAINPFYALELIFKHEKVFKKLNLKEKKTSFKKKFGKEIYDELKVSKFKTKRKLND